MSKKVVCFGEVLCDVLPRGIYLGGSPLNVALNLDNLGIDSEIVSAVGKDRLGRLVLKSIKQKGLSTDLILVNDYPTGLAEVEVDDNGVPDFTIQSNSAWDFITLSEKISAEVSKSDFLVFGSLIFRNTSGSTLRELLQDYKGKCVVDINLRSPFYDEKIIQEVLGHADILKLNTEELQVIKALQNKVLNVRESLFRLSEEYNIETILLSLGDKGAYILNEGQLNKRRGCKVKVGDTVGAGDAFLAGAIYGILKGKDSNETIDFANALGAFVASKNGATPNLDREKINNLLSYRKLI